MFYVIIEGLIVGIITILLFKVTTYTILNKKNRNDSVWYALFMLALKMYIAFCAAMVVINNYKGILYDIKFINNPTDDYFTVWLNSILK